MSLIIAVEFLLNRFAGSDGHDTTPPEWPPAPARLFSALVAGCHAEHAEALRWLERQPLPEIHAPETVLGPAHPQYLVTNAVSVGGGSSRHPGRTNVMRTRRRRWLRTPTVWYVWRGADPPPPVRQALDDAASRVPYLGRPSSPVSVRLVAGEPPPDAELGLWTAGGGEPGTTSLRVPFVGYFDALCDAYTRGGRVEPPRYASYGPRAATTSTEPPEATSPWGHLIILRLDSRQHLPGQFAVAITHALRQAVLDRLGDAVGDAGISPYLSGHGVRAPHAAWLALPFVGHEKADGHLLGVGIAVPDNAAATEALRQLRTALHDETVGDLAITLTNLGKRKPVKLVRARPSSRLAWSLRPERWEGLVRDGVATGATTWRTVLPAVLDKVPRRDLGEEQVVVETIVNAGFPIPVEVEAGRGPLVAGDVALRPSQTVRNRGDHVRPFRHLRFTFDRPVRGPVVVGAMRHFGLGLCVPEQGADRG